MGPFTLVDIVMAAIQRDASCVAKHKVNGAWTEISSNQLHQAVVTLAGILDSWGILKGDRIAILSENRPEWAITDFATVSIGAVDVPIYATLTAEQEAVILKDSRARILFVSSREQLEKFTSIEEKTAIEKVVIFDQLESPLENNWVPLIEWSSIFSSPS